MKLHSILAVALLTCVTGSAIAQVEPAQDAPPTVAPVTTPQMLPGQYEFVWRILRISGLTPGEISLREKQMLLREQPPESRCYAGADGPEGELLPFLGQGGQRCRIVSSSLTGNHAIGTVRCQNANSYEMFTYDGEFEPDSARFRLEATLHSKHATGANTAVFDVTITRTSATCEPPSQAAAQARKAAMEAAALATEAARAAEAATRGN